MKKIFLGLVLVVAFSTISIEKKDLMSKEITLDQLVKLNVADAEWWEDTWNNRWYVYYQEEYGGNYTKHCDYGGSSSC